MKTTSAPETATTTPGGLEPLMSLEELSEYLHVPIKTLYDWRLTGKGPCAVRVGRQLRFFVGDVHDWLASQREQQPGITSSGA
ncbi:AlpA family transcriptional regulator [Nocardioides sp. Root79]|nr:AlpA family transcriptional regulator [Nocardioides sp. Root79]KRC74000.1 AlpA family transcriptional regulator [Nocardioides sp. Root240]